MNLVEGRDTWSPVWKTTGITPVMEAVGVSPFYLEPVEEAKLSQADTEGLEQTIFFDCASCFSAKEVKVLCVFCLMWAASPVWMLCFMQQSNSITADQITRPGPGFSKGG